MNSKTNPEAAEQRLRRYLQEQQAPEVMLDLLQDALNRVEAARPGTAAHDDARNALESAARALLRARAEAKS